MQKNYMVQKYSEVQVCGKQQQINRNIIDEGSRLMSEISTAVKMNVVLF
jgi:hypothetical protein